VNFELVTKVKTNIAEEYGVNADAIINFINNSSLFSNIISDFKHTNLVFEDEENERDMKLKVKTSKGKVSEVSDGHHKKADVTIYLDLEDALEMVEDYEDVNIFRMLSFAKNVRTEPSHIKREIISKVLKGGF
jgi:hypothetical protein